MDFEPKASVMAILSRAASHDHIQITNPMGLQIVSTIMIVGCAPGAGRAIARVDGWFPSFRVVIDQHRRKDGVVESCGLET